MVSRCFSRPDVYPKIKRGLSTDMSTASPGPPGISNYKPGITSQEPSSDLQDAVKHPHSIVIPLFGQVIIDAPYSVQTKK